MQEFVNLEGGTNWGPLMAAATLATVPALLTYLVAQRYVLESFVTAGLKE
jgi:sn-glycerol 3-phosphate transport system permease protein